MPPLQPTTVVRKSPEVEQWCPKTEIELIDSEGE